MAVSVLRRRGVKHPSRAARIFTHPMRIKHTSHALKQQRKTFHLARHDPEHWEQEKEAARLENLHEARERASAAEREAKADKELLKNAQQQVSVVVVREDKLQAHGTNED